MMYLLETGNYEIFDSEYHSMRNLFYVAVTRSIKNLFILNMTSISNEDLETIFS